MKIPFICVNYNTADETIKYIENVRTLEGSSDAVIVVVDNSPNEEDFARLVAFTDQNLYPKEEVVILRRENRGYFQGLNDGIAYAKQTGRCNSFFIVGNNDIVFKNDFITQLKQNAFDEEVFVLAPDIVTTEGSHENPHVIDRIGFLRKFKYDVYYSNYFLATVMSKIKSTERRYKPYDPERKIIHMGIGALYVLTPSFFKHFHQLWEDVFLYGEEAILAGQLQSKNGKILYEPSLICYHNESATTSKMESKAKYYIVKKSYKTYRKYL